MDKTLTVRKIIQSLAFTLVGWETLPDRCEGDLCYTYSRTQPEYVSQGGDEKKTSEVL